MESSVVSSRAQASMSCCSGTEKKAGAPSEADLFAGAVTSDRVHESVKDYYGKVLSSTKDLKTSACTSVEKPHPAIVEALRKVPTAVTSRFYGCGNPIPLDLLGAAPGAHVLDLGSGSGRDCYVAAALVGPNGSVTGIDMTEEQLEVARANAEEYCTKTLGYPGSNLRFVKGFIEDVKGAGVKPGSIDLAISNCVVNLSPDKAAVLRGVYEALKEGGQFYFSDVYCDRRLPEAVRKHDVLVGECIGGALYLEDFYRICASVGFADARIVSSAPIEVTDPELKDLVGNARFVSITFRLWKLKSLESKCEDFGQVAVYKGTIPGAKHSFALDQGHTFVTGKPELVCGNTASMLEETWLRGHFTVTGDRSVHYGLFPCAPGGSTSLWEKPSAANSAGSGAGAGTCGGGSCC